MNRAALGLIVSVSFLFVVGLVMVFNTTAAEIIDRSLNVNTHAALLKQVAYGIIGVTAGFFCYFYGARVILRYSGPLLVAVVVLLVCVFIPGVGQILNGARRWIGFAGFTFQPSECAKILVPLCFIRWVVLEKDPSFWRFAKCLGLLGIPVALIFFEPDNGTTVIILTCLTVLFWLARVRWTYWVLPLLTILFIGGMAAARMPHVPDRIRIYLNPELDLRGKGHQPHQAKIAAGSGQLLGRGLGESLQKLNYLPEARSDYIAAIFAEECGFIGILAMIILYMTFAFSGFSIAMRCKTQEEFLSAAFLTFLIAFQAFLNLGVVSGLLPSKGMTLPFFSQGGSSLIMNIVALFLLLDLSRTKRSAIGSPLDND